MASPLYGFLSCLVSLLNCAVIFIMLEPIHPLVKAEALRYGDLVQLCYDAFDGESYSLNYYTCYCSKRDLLERMGMSGNAYQVTKYIYANTDVLNHLFGEKEKDGGVWIDLIAVCTDAKEITRLGRRDIVVAWRGTQTTQEWIEDLKDVLVPARVLSYTSCPRRGKYPNDNDNDNKNDFRDGVLIERGFLSCYTLDVHQDEDSSSGVGSTSNMISTKDLVVSKIERLLGVYEREME